MISYGASEDARRTRRTVSLTLMVMRSLSPTASALEWTWTTAFSCFGQNLQALERRFSLFGE